MIVPVGAWAWATCVSRTDTWRRVCRPSHAFATKQKRQPCAERFFCDDLLPSFCGVAADWLPEFISHAADAVTRTYRVEVEIPNDDYSIRDGLSAELILTQGSVMAHRGDAMATLWHAMACHGKPCR